MTNRHHLEQLERRLTGDFISVRDQLQTSFKSISKKTRDGQKAMTKIMEYFPEDFRGGLDVEHSRSRDINDDKTDIFFKSVKEALKLKKLWKEQLAEEIAARNAAESSLLQMNQMNQSLTNSAVRKKNQLLVMKDEIAGMKSDWSDALKENENFVKDFYFQVKMHNDIVQAETQRQKMELAKLKKDHQRLKAASKRPLDPAH